MKLTAIIITTALLAALAAGCTSSEIAETAETVDSGIASVAHEGYDTVAYFAADKATMGSAQFSFIWNGAKWLFSNRENLEKFKSNPAQFAPQFGSHCPVSLANGGMQKGSPKFWKVSKDKLYFFNSKDLADQFEKDPAPVLEKAAKNYKSE